MGRFLNVIENINEWIGRVASWTICVITVLVVVEVILRRFFNSPTVWSFEVVTQSYAFFFMIVAAYTLLHGSHVCIDFVYAKLSAKTQCILDIISYAVFFFPFFIIIFWGGSIFAKASWVIREKSWSYFAPPVYPIKTVIPVTALLFLLQGFVIFVRRLLTLFKGAR